MIRNWIRYLILLLIATVLYVFYVGYVSWFLFVLTITLPVISLCLFVLGQYHLSIKFHGPERIDGREEKTPSLLVKTYTFIPLACVKVSYTIQNVFMQEEEQQEIKFAAHRHQSELQLPCSNERCGQLKFHVNQVLCYDMLGLFRKRKHIRSDWSTIQFPKEAPWQDIVPVHAGEELENAPGTMGIDPTDVVGVHEYRPQDPIHQIHWKLSAKKDAYMVKEFNKLALSKTTIYFEFLGSREDCEQTLTNVMNFSIFLLQEGHPHEITEIQNIEPLWRRTITNRTDLDALLCMILSHTITTSSVSTNADILQNDHSFLIGKDGISNRQGGDLDAQA